MGRKEPTIKPKLTKRNFDRAVRLLLLVTDFLEKHGVAYHLEGGTLLGIVRDGDLLPWDYDVDISIPASEVSKVEKIRRGLLHRGWRFRRGYVRESYGPLRKGALRIFKVKFFLMSILKEINQNFRRQHMVLDIFVKYSDEHHTYWQAKERFMRVENRHYESYETVEYRGRKLRVPNHYEDYLTAKYGDWRVPVKEWDCGENELTICGAVETKQA